MVNLDEAVMQHGSPDFSKRRSLSTAFSTRYRLFCFYSPSLTPTPSLVLQGMATLQAIPNYKRFQIFIYPSPCRTYARSTSCQRDRARRVAD